MPDAELRRLFDELKWLTDLPGTVYGQRVRIYGEHGMVYGVVGTKPGHILFYSGGVTAGPVIRSRCPIR